MNAFAQALSAALLHFAWQASAAGFLAWFALLLLRKRPAKARYMVSCAALGVTALLPGITLWLVYPTSAPASSASAAAATSQSVAWMTVVPAAMPWFVRLQAWASARVGVRRAGALTATGAERQAVLLAAAARRTGAGRSAADRPTSGGAIEDCCGPCVH